MRVSLRDALRAEVVGVREGLEERLRTVASNEVVVFVSLICTVLYS